jgi:hypothetical protein
MVSSYLRKPKLVKPDEPTPTISADDDDADQRQTAPEVPEHLMSSDSAEPVDEPDEAEVPEPAEETEQPADEPAKKPTIVTGSGQNIFGRFRFWINRHKRISYPLILLIVIGLVLGVPFTRYKALGLVLKRDYAVVVYDNTTKKPVSGATISLGKQHAKSDNHGQVRLHLPVGNYELNVSKKYYRATSGSVLVPIKSQQSAERVFITATGRQVPVKAINKISGQPLDNILIRAEGSEVRTDSKGEAVFVLPADKQTVAAKLSGDGYNDLKANIVVTDQVDGKNSFALTPAGKLYFLSKLSGKLDVVKTNLDGSERQTVLAGTGNESSTDTVLLASRDWKYLALRSKRDNNQAKLYLIDTAHADALTTIDEGNATFTPVGWYGNRFIYVTYRNNVPSWQPYAQALKSYDASSDKLSVLDQTTAEGTGQYDYAYTSFSSVYILENELVYAKNWFASNSFPSRLNGKKVSLVSAKPDGSGKTTVKEFAVPDGTQYGYSLQILPYEPQGLYIQDPNTPLGTFYAYENAAITAAKGMTYDKFYGSSYPTYLLSPSGSKTFWADPRDGKYSLIVGDAEGKNGKQIAELSDYNAYGWYTDDYVLVSKGSSELYILPAAGGTALKVTDYHKPGFDLRGYGYGYGGL